MSAKADLGAWLIDVGVELAEKQAAGAVLSPLERLVERIWFVDYCLQNAGDLANLEDEPEGEDGYLAAIAEFAKTFGLAETSALFSLPAIELETHYFGRFEVVCSELKSAWDELSV